MNDKEAIEVLKEMLKKYSLTEKESEAVHEAIGMLAWSSLTEGKLEQMRKAKERRESAEPERKKFG